MALLFVDGFDYWDNYVTSWALPGKWTTSYFFPDYAPAAGRHASGYCIHQYADYGYLYKTLESNYITILVGLAFNATNTDDVSPFLKLGDAATVHLYLQMDASRHIALYKGDGSLLGTGVAELANGTWYYIEAKATIADVSGECIVRVNEVEQINYSGDTRNAANAYVNRVTLFGRNDHSYYDDFIILDTTGPAPFNDFLGFIRVDTIRPSGAGSNTEWVPSAGSNYQCVDETRITAATIGSDYVAVSGEAHTDTYAMANVPVDLTGSVFAVATNVVAFKAGTAVTSVVPALLIGGNMYSGESLDASVLAYTNYQDIQTVSPATAAAWTSGELNALEFGIIKKY
jgi:hypothetical protein